MRFVNDPLLASADATQASQTSVAVNASNLMAASVGVVAVGGTITGTLKLQACNDNPAATGAPTNWVDISGATVSVTGAGNFLIPKLDCAYQYLRVVYTKTTSAAGALISANINAIGF